MGLGTALKQAASALWLGNELALQRPHLTHLPWEADRVFTEHLTEDRPVFPLTAGVSSAHREMFTPP